MLPSLTQFFPLQKKQKKISCRLKLADIRFEMFNKFLNYLHLSFVKKPFLTGSAKVSRNLFKIQMIILPINTIANFCLFHFSAAVKTFFKIRFQHLTTSRLHLWDSGWLPARSRRRAGPRRGLSYPGLKSRSRRLETYWW